MKLVIDNPFRILGVYSNASAKDVSANTNRIKAFTKVGKYVSFPIQLNNVLQAVVYTEDTLNSAISEINLPKDKLKYSLFWFIKESSLDDIALKHLQNGNKEKAKEILEKKETFSSLINVGVIYCIEGNISAFIENVSTVIHTTQYRNDLVTSVCGDTFTITENNLTELFINSLLEENDVFDVLEIYNDLSFFNSNYTGEIDYLTVKIQDNIDSEISKAKVDKNDATGNLNAGRKLKHFAEEVLPKIKESLREGNPTYQMICDKFAKQILQNGINYYNESKESTKSVDNALVLQQYALNIAKGKITKQRCQENVNILFDIKQKSEIENKIKPYLNSIVGYINKIKTSDLQGIYLILNSSSTNSLSDSLKQIKDVLGGGDSTYINISSSIVNGLLSRVIELINGTKNKRQAQQALDILTKLASFDMDSSTKSRLIKNKEILSRNISVMPSTYDTIDEVTGGCISYILGWVVIGIIFMIIAAIAETCS